MNRGRMMHWFTVVHWFAVMNWLTVMHWLTVVHWLAVMHWFTVVHWLAVMSRRIVMYWLRVMNRRGMMNFLRVMNNFFRVMNRFGVMDNDWSLMVNYCLDNFLMILRCGRCKYFKVFYGSFCLVMYRSLNLVFNCLMMNSLVMSFGAMVLFACHMKWLMMLYSFYMSKRMVWVHNMGDWSMLLYHLVSHMSMFNMVRFRYLVMLRLRMVLNSIRLKVHFRLFVLWMILHVMDNLWCVMVCGLCVRGLVVRLFVVLNLMMNWSDSVMHLLMMCNWSFMVGNVHIVENGDSFVVHWLYVVRNMSSFVMHRLFMVSNVCGFVMNWLLMVDWRSFMMDWSSLMVLNWFNNLVCLLSD